MAWCGLSERKSAARRILSIDRSNHNVEARLYLVFTSELGQRKRSREAVGDDWTDMSIGQLHELFEQGGGLPPLSK